MALSKSARRELEAEAVRLREKISRNRKMLESIESLLKLDASPITEQIPFPEVGTARRIDTQQKRRLKAPEIRKEIVHAIPLLGGFVMPVQITTYLHDRGISGTGDTKLSVIVRNQMSAMKKNKELERTESGKYHLPDYHKSAEVLASTGVQECSD